MRVVALVSLCCCALAVVLAQEGSPTPVQQATDEKTIRALITQLGDDSFDKRLEAETKLIAVGRPAQTLLTKAAKESSDAEVRDSAVRIIKSFRTNPGPGLWFPEGLVFDATFLKDGQGMAVACHDKVVRIYDGKTNALRQTLKGHSASVYGVAYSPAGNLLASCSGNWSAETNKSPGEIIIWNLAKGEAAVTLNGPPGGLYSLVFAADGKKLYSAGGDGTIRMWDVDGRKEIKVGHGHTKPVRRLVLSPDGKLLASAGIDGTVRFWDVDTLREVRQILAHPNGVGTLTFSPDNKYLLTAVRAGAPPTPGIIKVWDLATFTEKISYQGQSKILSLAVSPDSTLVAVGGGLQNKFGDVAVLDLATGAERAVFRDHKEWVECVIFSPDGKWLASGGGFNRGGRGEMRLWDVKRLVAKGE